jgi:predicted unusual protein kinase regulating ubiquinone biosynthesis (AarF/ABC1/UbiB family)
VATEHLGGRIGRAVSLARAGARVLIAGQHARRRDEPRAEARHRQAAEALVQTLGRLRGLPTKLGQLASFMDTALVPPAWADLYQDALAKLRTTAPPTPAAVAWQVFTEDHGAPPEQVFDAYDETPVAVASLGQVHRARLRDGRAVVVKIQFPGIEAAIRADLSNAVVLDWVGRLLAPGLDARAALVATERSLLHELDYLREAAWQERFAAHYRGHPFILVPAPIRALCTPRTLVVEDLPGRPFAEILQLPQAERDRVAEILLRFGFGTLARVGMFNTDLHPGNYALREDGRVVFYDFGAVQEISSPEWQRYVRMTCALVEGRTEALHAACVARGFVRRPDRVSPAELEAYLRFIVGPLILEGAPAPTRAWVAEVAASALDPRHPVHRVGRWLNLPPESLGIARLQVGLMAVLAQLRSTVDVRVLAREWIYGSAPTSALGRVDTAFFAAGDSPSP